MRNCDPGRIYTAIAAFGDLSGCPDDTVFRTARISSVGQRPSMGIELHALSDNSVVTVHFPVRLPQPE